MALKFPDSSPKTRVFDNSLVHQDSSFLTKKGVYFSYTQRKDVDLKHGRLWVARVKGSLSTEQPLLPEELRVLKRYLKERSNAQLPWLFLTERGEPFTRFALAPMKLFIPVFGSTDH
jgi:hypothetical protein